MALAPPPRILQQVHDFRRRRFGGFKGCFRCFSGYLRGVCMSVEELQAALTAVHCAEVRTTLLRWWWRWCVCLFL